MEWSSWSATIPHGRRGVPETLPESVATLICNSVQPGYLRIESSSEYLLPQHARMPHLEREL